jgi:hypothetical protein
VFHRLGTLEMGVAGHRPVRVPLSELEQDLHQLAQAPVHAAGLGAHEHRHVGRDLIVPGTGGVELPTSRPDQLGEPPLDRGVDVLVGGPDLEAAVLQLLRDLVEPAGQPLGLLARQDARRGEHSNVRLRLHDVVARQPPVEADRGVQALEGGVGWVPKA